MQLDEAKAKFLQSWGTLGSKWGVNRTMAQLHALLLISPDALSADEIMEDLGISRGNANMNLRALIDWGLVMKELKPGERREYFYAEKDIWKVARRIIIQRKKRELEPVRRVLDEVKDIEGEGADVAAFQKAVADISEFASVAENTLDRMTKAEKNWMMSYFLKMMKD